MSRMTKIERESKIQYAIDYCDEEEKSTEFLLQFAQDVSGSSLDQVLDYWKRSQINTNLAHRDYTGGK